MQNFEAQENCNFFDLSFLLGKISQLRLEKGHYLSEEFAHAVFDAYNAFSVSLAELYTQIYFPASPPQQPEFISESMVDLCITSIEAAVQELIVTKHKKTRSQIVKVMSDIAQSIYDLSFYIRHTLNRKQGVVNVRSN